MYGQQYGQHEYHFRLNIGPEQLLRLYSGAAQKLRVTTDRGLVLELNANHLRSFTTRSGVSGHFKLVTNSENRFVRLEKVGP